ncbi:MAG: linear amide C-N hydrolase [Clostridia bacterium]|nr:linear amide C-N hydrolase [Clostridia bacterium]
MKKGKKVLIGIIAVIVVIAAVALGVFQGELRTLLAVDCDTENGIYTVDYSADYKLDELIEEGGADSEEKLAQYIIKVMLKGLPVKIEYSIPELACSTFIAQTPEKGFIFGRNLDNQTTDLAVVKTSPKDGYSSVSVVNLSFLGYNDTYTPAAMKDRLLTLAVPFFPLDGVNEKGLAVGVLQLQAPVTAQDTGKPDVGTTLAIRLLLDKAANVQEAIDLLKTVDMHASAKGCYHLQIADAQGRSVVVSYVNNEMRITEPEDGILCATNFYLHDVPFEYEKQGMDRYEKLIETLTEADGVLSKEEGMELLDYVSIIGTDPDEKGRVYSTQWSSIYDLTNPALNLCTDRDYETVYTFEVE